MVGVRGFEPPTPCSQSRCATGLRHTPNSREYYHFTPSVDLLFRRYQSVANASSKARASFRSKVSNPSVNQA